jgi:hypothetical protein
LAIARACWISERAILLIRTVLAMVECWLKRRGEVGRDVDEDVVVECKTSPLFAVTIGGAAGAAMTNWAPRR